MTKASFVAMKMILSTPADLNLSTFARYEVMCFSLFRECEHHVNDKDRGFMDRDVLACGREGAGHGDDDDFLVLELLRGRSVETQGLIDLGNIGSE